MTENKRMFAVGEVVEVNADVHYTERRTGDGEYDDDPRHMRYLPDVLEIGVKYRIEKIVYHATKEQHFVQVRNMENNELIKWEFGYSSEGLFLQERFKAAELHMTITTIQTNKNWGSF